jgi:NitT/TauT family transport system substrate-binding protein
VKFHRSFQYLPGSKCVAFVFILLNISLCGCNSRHEPSLAKENPEPIISPDNSKTVRRVKLLPYWFPSAQFAGYYVGIEKKIFLKHGIELEILPFDPQVPVDSIINEKKADFALMWLFNALEMRDKGADIVNIAQFSFRSSLLLLTKKSSGIMTLRDMNGKRAGVWLGFERQPQTLFKKYNVNVELVPIGNTNNLFLLGGIDIITANWFDEYHSLINNGINEDELNKFFFADYGFNFLEDGIYCLREKIESDPRLCRDFGEAALESWTYAFNNQEEAVKIVVKYAKAQNQPVNESHQMWMLKAYKELYIRAGRDSINTRMALTDYNRIQQILVENKFIAKYTPFESFYKPCLNVQDK